MLERVLISGRNSALCAVEATRRSLEAGQRIENIAELFESIIEHVASTMERVVDRLAHDLDAIEEEVLSDEEADLRKGLGQLRRTCVRLHRQLSGMQQVFHRLERRNVAGAKPGLQIAAAKLAQRLDGLDRSLVEMRESSRLLQEELQLKVEEQGNDNLRVLSVLTALLMPPTLVTGIFGMNTQGAAVCRERGWILVGGGADRDRAADRLCRSAPDRNHPIARRGSRYAADPSFSPTMPVTISARHSIRSGSAGSPNAKIPTIMAPAAPIPVHTA